MRLSKQNRRRLVDRRIVEFLMNGKGVNEICRELRIGKERVRRIRLMAIEYGYLGDDKKPVPLFPEAIFPDLVDQRSLRLSDADRSLQVHIDWIKGRLEAGWFPVTIHEELLVKVARSSFYRFLARHKLDRLGEHARRRVVPEIVHHPGEAILIDWGKLTTVVDEITGKRKILWAFVGVLGYSRYMMVRLVWTNDVATTLDALESMFSELGGVTKKLTTDNPKCFSLKADKYEPVLNPAFERFARHYDFAIECLPPRDPEKKGKVERPMPFVRRLYQAHEGRWSGLLESQDYMNRKLVIANERKHGTTSERPIDRFINEESNALKSLPSLTFERQEYHEGVVRKDGHVRFRGKYYSLDEAYCGKAVQIMATEKMLTIYHNGKLVETHARVTSRLESKSTKPQHRKPWERSMEEVSIYRDKAQRLGPYVDQLVTRIIGNGMGFIDFRKVWGILSLDKTFAASEIDLACEKAIAMHSESYQTVRKLLECGVKPVTNETKEIPLISKEEEVKRKTNMFVRSLTEYQERVEGTYN